MAVGEIRIKDGGEPIEIRWAAREEWKPAMMMIWKTFMEFEGKEYSQEGIRSFFEFITDDDIYRAFLSGTYQLMVALDKERIVGAGSIRNGNHLSLLFVDEEYHRRGIGRAILTKLCDYLQSEAGEFSMTVKAAPYAVDFYKKLGFHEVRPQEDYAGIRATSMEKFL